MGDTLQQKRTFLKTLKLRMALARILLIVSILVASLLRSLLCIPYRSYHPTPLFWVEVCVRLYCTTLAFVSSVIAYGSIHSAHLHVLSFTRRLSEANDLYLVSRDFTRIKGKIDNLSREISLFMFSKLVIVSLGFVLTVLALMERNSKKSETSKSNMYFGAENFLGYVAHELVSFWMVMYSMHATCNAYRGLVAAVSTRYHAFAGLPSTNHFQWHSLVMYITASTDGPTVCSRQVDVSFIDFVFALHLALSGIVLSLALSIFL